MRDTTGNLPPLPGIFPDYMAPVVRNAPDGVRELAMGMPGPPQFGVVPVTITKRLPCLGSLERTSNLNYEKTDAIVAAQ